jgi:predicted dehydrogenase
MIMAINPKINRRGQLQLALAVAINSGLRGKQTQAAQNPPAATAQNKYRVGLIGHTGRGDFGHGLDRMWQRLESTTTVAISDSAGITHAQARLPGIDAFDDYEKMLRVTRPDIVAIAPRHIDQHHDMCIAAIANGAKGIYIEKPFCQTPLEADSIIEACNRSNVKLAVAHRNRYHPVLEVIQKLIQRGEIGKPLEIRARGKEDHRGGALDLWVLGSHVLNVACFFAGSPKTCQARLYLGEKPCESGDVIRGAEGVGPIAGNRLHARFEMSSGIPLFFDSIANHGSREAGFGLQIIGNEGVIDLRMDQEPLAHLRGGNPQKPTNIAAPWQVITTAGIGKPETQSGLSTFINSHQAAGEDLISAIANHTLPKCDAEQGRQTVEMICSVFASHQQEGAAIALPLEKREHPLALPSNG